MTIEPGTYTLGPQSGTLSIRTGKHGAAAKAGHNLLIEVQTWSASVALGAEPAQTQLSLDADSRSLKVIEGTGGMHGLSDDDKVNIAKTINDEVLKGTKIAFRSTSVSGSAERMTISGELELSGRTKPVAFELAVGEGGRLTGAATVKQSTWGIKPYSTLFGALKVNDEVEVIIDATVPAGG